MHHPGRPTLLLSLLLLIPAMVHAEARPAPLGPQGLPGAYVLDKSASDNVVNAIGDVTEEMSFFVKPFARMRLRKLNEPPARLRIGLGRDSFVLLAEGEPEIRSPLDGAWTKWTPSSGGAVDVRAEVEDSGVKLAIAGKQGTRVHRFWPSADGKTLTVAVLVTSPRLPQPLAYQLVYRRV